MRHIESKQEFYKYSRQLLLGNILQQWTWEQFVNEYSTVPCRLPKIVGVRHVRQAFTNKGTSGLMSRTQALNYGRNTPDKENLLFDEGAVHGSLTIQGEAMADERGLYVRYSHLQCHQRTLWHIDHYGLTGLTKHQMPHNLEDYYYHVCGAPMFPLRPIVEHARGLKATHLLQQYMDADSWDMFNQIMSCQHDRVSPWKRDRSVHGNTFGDPVVNFTHPVVEFACFSKRIGVFGWNTLFWEVRTRY